MNLECRLTRVLEFGKLDVINSELVFGEVVRVHIADSLMRDDVVNSTDYHVVGRMGWSLYTRCRDQFALREPYAEPEGRRG